jgi:hypothetical protein
MQHSRQNPPPARDARTFQDVHCNEMQIIALDRNDQACPICAVRYGDGEHEGEEPEKAIQIDFGACNHVFGHRCLQKLITCQEGWSNKCPLCRAHWFDTFRDIDARALAEAIFEIQQDDEWEREDYGDLSGDEELYDPHTYLERLIGRPESPEFIVNSEPRNWFEEEELRHLPGVNERQLAGQHRRSRRERARGFIRRCVDRCRPRISTPLIVITGTPRRREPATREPGLLQTILTFVTEMQQTRLDVDSLRGLIEERELARNRANAGVPPNRSSDVSAFHRDNPP